MDTVLNESPTYFLYKIFIPNPFIYHTANLRNFKKCTYCGKTCVLMRSKQVPKYIEICQKIFTLQTRILV